MLFSYTNRIIVAYSNIGIADNAVLICKIPGIYKTPKANSKLYIINSVGEQPESIYLERIYYDPLGYDPSTWDITGHQEYLDEFFAINCLKDDKTNEIVGWE